MTSQSPLRLRRAISFSRQLSKISFNLLIGIAAALTPAMAETIILKGTGALPVLQKMLCGTTEEGMTRYGIFEGNAYSRVPGEKDRHLFNVLGINTRQCNVVEDKKRGKGFRSVSREIMVYMDPETGKIIDQWENPWTNDMIEVMHVENDPVNMRGFRYEKAGKNEEALELTVRRYGDVAVSSLEIPLFYDNPLGGDYQSYVGGKYHAMEIFNDFYDADRLLDPSVAVVGQNQIAWTRVAQWLPWLEMGDRTGLMVFNATGFSTLNKTEIPETLMDILEDRYPLYLTPPELDDERANETSWTVFKDNLETKQ